MQHSGDPSSSTFHSRASALTLYVCQQAPMVPCLGTTLLNLMRQAIDLCCVYGLYFGLACRKLDRALQGIMPIHLSDQEPLLNTAQNTAERMEFLHTNSPREECGCAVLWNVKSASMLHFVAGCFQQAWNQSTDHNMSQQCATRSPS